MERRARRRRRLPRAGARARTTHAGLPSRNACDDRGHQQDSHCRREAFVLRVRGRGEKQRSDQQVASPAAGEPEAHQQHTQPQEEAHRDVGIEGANTPMERGCYCQQSQQWGPSQRARHPRGQVAERPQGGDEEDPELAVKGLEVRCPRQPEEGGLEERHQHGVVGDHEGVIVRVEEGGGRLAVLDQQQRLPSPRSTTRPIAPGARWSSMRTRRRRSRRSRPRMRRPSSAPRPNRPACRAIHGHRVVLRSSEAGGDAPPARARKRVLSLRSRTRREVGVVRSAQPRRT